MKSLKLSVLPRILGAAVMMIMMSGASPASAQPVPDGAASVSISPPTKEFEVSPGQTVTHRISLVNGSSVTRTFNGSVKNFTPSGDSGQAQLTDDDGAFSLKEWLNISPPSATIDSGKTKDFDVTITVPANASPGGHYGAVVFTPLPSNDPNANLSVQSEVSSLLLVTVSGDIKKAASLVNFKGQAFPEPKNGAAPSTDASQGVNKSFFQKGPVIFAAKVKNEGNVTLKPTGTVTIYNIFGSKIKTLQIAPQNVLPQSTRKLTAVWDNSALFGSYTAKVDLTYGSDQHLKGSTSIKAAPLGKTIITIIVAIAVVLLLWLPRNRYKKAFKALTASDTPKE